MVIAVSSRWVATAYAAGPAAEEIALDRGSPNAATPAELLRLDLP